MSERDKAFIHFGLGMFTVFVLMILAEIIR